MFPRIVRLAAAALAALAFSAHAQYPTKPVRIVVPFPGGSATDVITRILANALAGPLKQPVIVENKPGADGAIGGTEVARAAPDGYTLFLGTNSPMSAVPALRKSPPYDPVKDFTPITEFGRYTFFLFAHPSVPGKTLGEVIAYAKANPGKLAYATGNTTGIVSFAQMNAMAGIDLLHVPYKGEPAAITDLVAGRVQLMFATPTTGMPHVKDGKLRALATTLSKRSALLPDVPTMTEAGLPKFSIVSWGGVFAPARLPKEIRDRLHAEITAIMKQPEFIAQMDKQAFLLQSSTPEALGAFVKSQMDSYREILRAAGVQPE